MANGDGGNGNGGGTVAVAVTPTDEELVAALGPGADLVRAPRRVGVSGIDPTASPGEQTTALCGVLADQMDRLVVASRNLAQTYGLDQRRVSRDIRATAREIRATIQLLAQLQGELQAQVQVTIGPCRCSAILLAALQRWPDLRAEVMAEVERAAITAGETTD